MKAGRVEVTHADRVVFPDDGITKGQLVEHYQRVAPFMLPHVKDRPLNLQRYPRGVKGDGFIQQDIAGSSPPDWVDTVQVSKVTDGTVRHAVANRVDALVWLANQNCVTLHAWLSRTGRLDSPDRIVIDLDPSTRGFAPVRDTAYAVRDLLTDLGLVPYALLTGSRGVHVVVPIRPGPGFDTARDFARDVADLVVADDPTHRTLAARKKDRGHRVYLDIMRNAYGQTAVAPYAVRARPGAPVAVPLEWDELAARGMRSDRYRLTTVSRRLARIDDPWADLQRHARSLDAARRRLDRIRTSGD